MLLPHYGNAVVTNQKSDVAADVVTELDQKIEEYLREELKKIEPGASFVGEETGGDRNAERFWLVDPIDGTAHFVRGMPFCTTMVALIDRGQVVFGVIYDFVNDVMYAAEKGKGTTINGVSTHVSERPLRKAYLGWESKFETEEDRDKFFALKKLCVPFSAMCVGYDLAMVAAGRLEGRVTFNGYGKDYDYAPGSLIVAEAGGHVANIGSTTYDYRNTNFITANPVIFEELTQGSDAIFPLA